MANFGIGFSEKPLILLTFSNPTINDKVRNDLLFNYVTLQHIGIQPLAMV